MKKPVGKGSSFPAPDELAIQVDQIRELVAKGRTLKNAIQATIGEEAWARLVKDNPKLAEQVQKVDAERVGRVQERAYSKACTDGDSMKWLERQDREEFGPEGKLDLTTQGERLQIVIVADESKI